MLQLELQKASEPTAQFGPSSLPCRINHNGHIEIDERMWNPTFEDQQKSATAYFRGRKLCGKKVELPQGYQGVMLRKTDMKVNDTTLKDAAIAELESRRNDISTEEYAEELEELRAASARGDLTAQMTATETVGAFDHIAVWGHDAIPSEEDEPYGKAMNEFLAFSEAVRIA